MDSKASNLSLSKNSKNVLTNTVMGSETSVLHRTDRSIKNNAIANRVSNLH